MANNRLYFPFLRSVHNRGKVPYRALAPTFYVFAMTAPSAEWTVTLRQQAAPAEDRAAGLAALPPMASPPAFGHFRPTMLLPRPLAEAAADYAFVVTLTVPEAPAAPDVTGPPSGGDEPPAQCLYLRRLDAAGRAARPFPLLYLTPAPAAGPWRTVNMAPWTVRVMQPSPTTFVITVPRAALHGLVVAGDPWPWPPGDPAAATVCAEVLAHATAGAVVFASAAAALPILCRSAPVPVARVIDDANANAAAARAGGDHQARGAGHDDAACSRSPVPWHCRARRPGGAAGWRI